MIVLQLILPGIRRDWTFLNKIEKQEIGGTMAQTRNSDLTTKAVTVGLSSHRLSSMPRFIRHARRIGSARSSGTLMNFFTLRQGRMNV